MMPQFADIFTTSTYEEYAAFANATVHIGPRFDVTFGGRYSRNDQFADQGGRSEEHTSELQSLMRRSYAVFCLKKNNNTTTKHKQYKKRHTVEITHMYKIIS